VAESTVPVDYKEACSGNPHVARALYPSQGQGVELNITLHMSACAAVPALEHTLYTELRISACYGSVQGLGAVIKATNFRKIQAIGEIGVDNIKWAKFHRRAKMWRASGLWGNHIPMNWQWNQCPSLFSVSSPNYFFLLQIFSCLRSQGTFRPVHTVNYHSSPLRS
jgi:hypothetical protein